MSLKGPVKIDFLTNRFGPRKFDYRGDSKADFPV